MLLLPLLLSRVHAACPATAQDLREAAAHARATWLDDAAGFPAQVATVLEQVRCTRDALSPELVAEVHALVAMDAFARRDPPAIYAAASGARSAVPGYLPGSDVAPDGSSLRRAFTQQVDAGSVRPLPAVAGARWRVDGRVDPAAALPVDRAVYLQQQDLVTDAVVRSWYLPRGGALSDLQLAPSVGASPLEEMQAWLGARKEPVQLALPPLQPVGDSAVLAQTLDLRLGGLLRRMRNLEVSSLTPVPGSNPAQGAAPGTDVVLVGSVGTLGSIRIVNLQLVDVASQSVVAQGYAEGSDADLAEGFPALLRDLFVRNSRGTGSEAVKHAVRGRIDELRRCAEASRESLNGRVRLGWSVTPQGAVSDARVLEDSLGDPGVGTCMVGRVSSWLFPIGFEGALEWNFRFSDDSPAPAR